MGPRTGAWMLTRAHVHERACHAGAPHGTPHGAWVLTRAHVHERGCHAVAPYGTPHGDVHKGARAHARDRVCECTCRSACARDRVWHLHEQGTCMLHVCSAIATSGWSRAAVPAACALTSAEVCGVGPGGHDGAALAATHADGPRFRVALACAWDGHADACAATATSGWLAGCSAGCVCIDTC